jgi:hypothetical protein
MLIATEKASVTNCDFKGEHNTLDFFRVVATLGVPASSEREGAAAPYDMHGSTQWRSRRFA